MTTLAHTTPRMGGGRSILPAVTGGLATLPRAPGPDQPPATAGQDRLCAALRVPGHVRPHPAQKAPDQDEAPAKSAGVAGADCLRAAPLASGPLRPRHAQKAPGSEQPPVTAGQDRLCAAPRVPEHARSHPAQRAPGQHEASASVAGVAGADRLRATFAAAARPDCSPVMPPPPDRDPTGHDSATGAPPASITQLTAPELMQLLAAAAAPPAGPSHPDHPAAQLAAKENGLWSSPNYSSPCRSGGTYRGAIGPTLALSL